MSLIEHNWLGFLDPVQFRSDGHVNMDLKSPVLVQLRSSYVQLW